MPCRPWVLHLKFESKEYVDSKADLYSMFLHRSQLLTLLKGSFSLITMQGWLFLSSFEKQRKSILSDNRIISIAHLGQRSFDSIGGQVVSTAAFIIQKGGDRRKFGDFQRLTLGRNELEKSTLLKDISSNGANDYTYKRRTETFDAIPGSPAAYWATDEVIAAFDKGTPIGAIAAPRQGLATNDNDKFLRFWHEVPSLKSKFNSRDAADAKASNKKWFPYNKGGTFRKWYGNNHHVVDWHWDGRNIKERKRDDLATGRITANNSKCWNEKFYFRDNITWSALSSEKISLRQTDPGFIFDTKGQCIFFERNRDKINVLAMLNSIVSDTFLSFLAPTLDYNSGVVAKVPLVQSRVDVDIIENCVALSKSDWDAFETSWDFTTLPLLQPDHRTETLEGTYTALRTHWQGMTDEMLTLEEENNRIFIDAYGLADELTPEVPRSEITLTCNPAYRYGIKNDAAANEARLRADTMAEFLSYAVGCMFGRYSLDAPGLILANQGETLADYLSRVPEPSFMPDEDNVIPVLDADWFPDDITDRFRQFLRVSFGEDTFRENLRFIEDALGKDIRKYFTKDVYADHVKRYKKRPIYWQFSSPKGSFQALIYMHRYRPDTVSVLLNEYLREMISKLEGAKAQAERLSDNPSASQSDRTKALKEVDRLAKMLIELHAWERDVVFELAQKKVEIDLDDGVKANYLKLGAALKPIKGLEAAEDE
jgi:hypothetical protein